MNKWDNRFLELAKHISTWSKDTSTKCGAVIVDERRSILAVGYNGLPRGTNDSIESRYERPIKYMYFEHAERNAIYNSAYNGVCLRDSTIYVTLFPCADCARAIIQSGIKRVVCPKDMSIDRWNDSFDVSKVLFEETNIEVLLI